MPRARRLDVPGVIHHVMARGIERRKIFKDKNDREEFLSRLSECLSRTGCLCYAWALMPNHYHLLIRTGHGSLSDLMRRLASGYAGYYNRRHRRVGHLFQNRYKSILCDEEEYFLEVVRYIHLNPLRTKIVSDVEELEKYPWTGHSAITGKKKREWQNSSEVLHHFSDTRRQAVNRYRKYIIAGASLGRRSDLSGGGLIRSAGGWRGIQALRQGKEKYRGDERILGKSDFVTEILKKYDERLDHSEEVKRAGWNFNKLVEKICVMCSVKEEELKKKGRGNSISKAKALISYIGKTELGLTRKALADYFMISGQAVAKNIRLGKKIAKEEAFELLSSQRPLLLQQWKN